ncbi:RWD domain-containing protein 3 [Nematostella vectensis]|uniref:RWD domain-containing protein 3 n=1 Tax=Nematostella vectensis TaxID=45351 RepID=UPI00138FCAD3|nr:RWD domain-containing protein 3 [Nematostella vectensis]
MELILEEIEALQAIFCKEGEFTLNFVSDDSACFSIKFPILASGKSTDELEMSVTLTDDSYPSSFPNISLSCSALTRKRLDNLRKTLQEFLMTLPNDEGKLLEIANWLQERSAEITSGNSTSNENFPKKSSNDELLIVKLDHMRSRSRYLRTLNSWAQELDLLIAVFLVHKFIFLVVQGQEHNLKEYLKRHKTCLVDVDSSGKPCKEKMMNVIFQTSWKAEYNSTGLDVYECSTYSHLQKSFSELGLSELYDEHIKVLLQEKID